MSKKFRAIVTCSLASVALLLSSGCGTGKKKEAEGPASAGDDIVLLSINKKPVVTKTQFYTILTAMVGKMDPTMLPADTQKKVLSNLAKFKIAVLAAEKAGITKDDEFKKLYAEQMKHMRDELLVRFYEKKKFDEIQVSANEKKEHFEKNKALFVKEQGGSLVYGVNFSDKEKALAFYDSVKGQMSEFTSLGKKEKDGRFREFGRVSAKATGYSMVPESVKQAALKLSKLPAVDVVKEKTGTWVIYVAEKKESSLYEFAEVEERIGNQLKMNKFMEARTKLYDDLEKEFEIEINEDYFKALVPAAPPASAAPAQQAQIR